MMQKAVADFNKRQPIWDFQRMPSIARLVYAFHRETPAA